MPWKIISIFLAFAVLILVPLASARAEARKDRCQDSPFGVLEFLPWNNDWNNYKYPDQESLLKVVSLMRQAGVSWVRMDFLWGEIEPEKGKLVFEKYDYIVDILSKSNIKILGILGYSAPWAGVSWNSPPYRDEDFVNYAANVVGRYKDKVKYWEIWNEPDYEMYFSPQDEMVRYTQLLKATYKKTKEVNPACRILTGGLSKYPTISLKRIYKNGGKGYFDILAIHPFVNPLNETSVQRLTGIYKSCKKLMQENGDDKKIWITEIGCPGVRAPDKTNGWWEGMSPTEAQQAEWVKIVYTGLLKEMPDCEKIFWAFFRDCKEHFKSGVDYFGLIRWDYSKKPAYYAYQKIAKENR